MFPNREVGVFLKSVPFRCLPTLASPTQTSHDRFSTGRIFEPGWSNNRGFEVARPRSSTKCHFAFIFRFARDLDVMVFRFFNKRNLENG
jgi:hypothetical protein